MKAFINFSNHPSSLWDEKQKKESMKYGTIIDVPFPSVDPDLSEEDILKLADKCAEKICSYNPAAVMCQGEFTLVYAVITKLKKKSIKVVAACSKRETTTEGNAKLSYFTFIRYREYAG